MSVVNRRDAPKYGQIPFKRFSYQIMQRGKRINSNNKNVLETDVLPIIDRSYYATVVSDYEILKPARFGWKNKFTGN